MPGRAGAAPCSTFCQCTLCGDITLEGALGEEGSAWEHQWFCNQCWSEWEEERWQDDRYQCGAEQEEERWQDDKRYAADWQSCTTAGECESLDDDDNEWWEGEHGQEEGWHGGWLAFPAVAEVESGDEDDDTLSASSEASGTADGGHLRAAHAGRAAILDATHTHALALRLQDAAEVEASQAESGDEDDDALSASSEASGTADGGHLRAAHAGRAAILGAAHTHALALRLQDAAEVEASQAESGDEDDDALSASSEASSTADSGHLRAARAGRATLGAARAHAPALRLQGAAEVEPPQDHSATTTDFLGLMLRLPVARTFWQLTEPLQGLNAQRSKCQHKLSAVSRGMMHAVSEACTFLSESELVDEVIGRWRAYEWQLAVAIRGFNRKQSATRPDESSFPLVPVNSDDPEEVGE